MKRLQDRPAWRRRLRRPPDPLTREMLWTFVAGMVMGALLTCIAIAWAFDGPDAQIGMKVHIGWTD